jgi:hypothetical protein
MKIPQQIPIKLAILFLLMPGFVQIIHAQSPPSKQDKQQARKLLIKNLVDSQHYVFNAQVAMPLGGHTIQLTGDYYDLKISRDAVVSYLPYYGRAYSAPLDPTQSGIQFTSKKFDYTSTPRKKGGWDILIKTKDKQDNWQLSLGISEDGYANLQVNGGNRQAISFTGAIAAPQQKH